MKKTETGLSGAVVIDPSPISDARGFFARTWCARTFGEWGLDPSSAQASVSFNIKAGTLRGLHYQRDPHGEIKLVRCTQGAIFDVIVDIRPDSPTFRRWFGAELTAQNHRALFIPVGFAHGFQTLVDATEVHYQISPDYVRHASAGIRHDDPRIGIEWPLTVTLISERDSALPALTP